MYDGIKLIKNPLKFYNMKSWIEKPQANVKTKYETLSHLYFFFQFGVSYSIHLCMYKMSYTYTSTATHK